MPHRLTEPTAPVEIVGAQTSATPPDVDPFAALRARCATKEGEAQAVDILCAAVFYGDEGSIADSLASDISTETEDEVDVSDDLRALVDAEILCMDGAAAVVGGKGSLPIYIFSRDTLAEALTAWLRARLGETEPARCTGITARWCPVHGDCVCDDEFCDERCPLHAPRSAHGEEPAATLATWVREAEQAKARAERGTVGDSGNARADVVRLALRFESMAARLADAEERARMGDAFHRATISRLRIGEVKAREERDAAQAEVARLSAALRAAEARAADMQREIGSGI